MLNTNTDLGGMSTNRNTEGVKGHNEIYFGYVLKLIKSPLRCADLLLLHLVLC